MQDPAISSSSVAVSRPELSPSERKDLINESIWGWAPINNSETGIDGGGGLLEDDVFELAASQHLLVQRENVHHSGEASINNKLVESQPLALKIKKHGGKGHFAHSSLSSANYTEILQNSIHSIAD